MRPGLSRAVHDDQHDHAERLVQGVDWANGGTRRMKSSISGTKPAIQKLVSDWIHMWPREALLKKDKAVRAALSILDKGGIYILYRDDIPYYVGRTGTVKGERTLRKRLERIISRVRCSVISGTSFRCGI